MNVVRKILFTVIGCFASIGATAQSVDCTTSGKLVCIVPYRTQAAPAGQTQAASIFSGPIGTQLSQLPLAASATGAVILTIHGNPEAYDNLGPVLVDRPDSVGQGKFVLGFSAQQFNFNHLNGIGIGSVPFVYEVPPLPSAPGTQQYSSQTIHAA